MKHYKEMGRQAGMTLIELTVVLLILIGLAGLLVPYVGSFTQTTHDSTNSNNLAQLNNAFGKYVSAKNILPPHSDLLTNLSATSAGTGSCSGAQTAGAIYCGLANSAMFTSTGYASGSIPATSIANSGMNMAVAHDASVANKTFGTSAGMFMLNTPTASGWATAKFAKINAVAGVGMAGMETVEDHVAKALGRDPMVYNSQCYDYIAVGLGDNSELIQSTMAASPVYFPQDATFGPTERYAHFLAILQVDNNNGTYTDMMGATKNCTGTTEKAKFLGVVANVPASESASLVGVGSALAQGWENKVAN